MSIIVQKFGGTSVADSEKILAAARKAIRAQREGNQVVMVVSAMGKNTDLLVSLAKELTDEPPAREMDMLLSTGEQVSVALMAMAIHSLGHEAISLTGAQIGIVTDSTHTKARIRSISTDRMRAALDSGKIVIAAGFQGVDDDFNITTLGRGGSDTTAVALAAVLGADSCEIYTDVDGVYTTDPRVAPEARRTRRINYDEMLELASAGAGVMHNRAIEFAKRFSVPIHVRSSFSDMAGTMITIEPESHHAPVCGAALARDEARVTIQGVPNRPGAALTIFSEIAAKRVAMDMIVQNVAADGHTDISFTVFRDDLPATMAAVEQLTQKLDVDGYSCDEHLAKVSVVGMGMATQTGVAEKMFRALAEKGINILMITTSEIKISVLVTKEQSQEALSTVHEVFQLDQEPADVTPEIQHSAHRPASVDATDLVAKIERMEDLIIEDITLDETQAMLTVTGLADSPGLAARLFEGVAAGGILVDMIVQSRGRQGQASITFTVPRNELDQAIAVTKQLATELGCPPPTHLPKVAKLSVCGIGMRSHTSVAERMFKSLALDGVNVEVISTSEVHVNIVVDDSQGKQAFETLQREFEDVIV